LADPASVQALAIYASQLGRVEAVIHTAGLSPSEAPPERIFEVDLLGTAIVIEMFQSVLAPGGTLVCIASIAGYILGGEIGADTENHLARAPLAELLENEFIKLGVEDPGYAYGLSKRANQLRVQAAARAYGKRGCRINSVSPGVIRSTMLRRDLENPQSSTMQALVDDSPARRFGTPSDIANAVAFLISPEASFITGTDIVVDGGSTATQKWGGFYAGDKINEIA
jgi:NAD(P)-dependent dehydrogenase (short-subunit alcohol dehydrogenase family)